MNRSEYHLDQLFKAARSGSPKHPGRMPEPLKREILADWRSSISVEDSWKSLELVFHRALICAGLVMVLSVIWSLGGLMRTPLSHVALANFELRTDLMP